MKDYQLPYANSDNAKLILDELACAILTKDALFLSSAIDLLNDNLNMKFELPAQLDLIKLFYEVALMDLEADLLSKVVTYLRRLSKSYWQTVGLQATERKDLQSSKELLLDPSELLQLIVKNRKETKKLEVYVSILKAMGRYFANSNAYDFVVEKIDLNNFRESEFYITLLVLNPYAKEIFKLWKLLKNDFDSFGFYFYSRHFQYRFERGLYNLDDGGSEFTRDDMKFLFTTSLKTFKLPVGSHFQDSTAPSILKTSKSESFASIIVYSLDNSDSYGTIELFEQFVKQITNFCHPSNGGQWSKLIAKFIGNLARLLLVRKKLESDRLLLPDSAGSKDFILEEQTYKKVSEILKPVIFSMLYSKQSEVVNASVDSLKKLSFICPSVFLQSILDNSFPAFAGLTESHRMYSSLMALDGVAPVLFREDLGRLHLVELLEMMVPAIDINDPEKTCGALFFVNSALAYCFISDCSKVRNDADSEIEKQIRATTARFESWLYQFFQRLFVLFENLPQNYGINASATYSFRNQEDVYLVTIIYTCKTIFAQISPELSNVLFNVLYRQMDTVLPQATVVFGSLIGHFVMAHPTYLPKFMTKAISNIKDEIENGSGSVQSSKKGNHPFGFLKMSDSSLHWNQNILLNLVVNGGRGLLDLKNQLFEVTKLMVENLKTRRGYEWTGEFIKNLLAALLQIYPVELSSLPRSVLSTQSFLDNSFKSWARPYERPSEIEWHLSSDEEIGFAINLLNQYFELFTQRLNDIMNRKTFKEDRLELLRFATMLKPLLEGMEVLLQPVNGFTHDNSVEELRINDPPRYQFGVEAGFIYKPGTKEHEYWSTKVIEVQSLLHKLASFVRETDADDIESITAIIELINTQVGMKNSQRQQTETTCKYIKYRLGSEKHHQFYPRSLVVRKNYVVHLKRVEHNLALGKNTIEVENLIDSLIEFSFSKYSQVRKSAQGVLLPAVSIHRTTRIKVLGKVLDCLQTYEKHQDLSRLKGALYILRTKSSLLGLCLYNWHFAAKYYEALISLKSLEVTKVLDLVSIGQYLDMVALTRFGSELSDPILKLAKDLSNVDSKRVEVGLKAQNDKIAVAKIAYENIIDNSVQFMQTRPMPWRFAKWTVQLLNKYLNRDFPVRAEFAAVVFENLVNDHPEVRFNAILLATKLFKVLSERAADQGKQHTKELKKVVLPGQPEFEEIKKLVNFDANVGFQRFIDQNIPTLISPSRIEYIEGSVFLTPYYDAESDQCQDYIRKFLSRQEFWSKVIKFASQDSPTAAFKLSMADFYKRVFHFTQFECLTIVLDILEPMIIDHDICVQKAAAEVFAGILRGSKYWNKEKQGQLINRLNQLYLKGLQSATHEVLPFWSDSLGYISQRRDPRRYFDIFSPLLQAEVDLTSESFYAESLKLTWIISVLIFNGSRCTQIVSTILDKMVRLVTTPYHQLREEIGLLMTNCLKIMNKNHFGQAPLENPESINRVFKDLQEWKKLPMQLGSSYTFGNASKTVLCWYLSSLMAKSYTGIDRYFSILIKETLDMQEMSEPDLSQMASKVLTMYPTYQHESDTLKEVLDSIVQVSATPKTWHTKSRVLPLIQVLYFRHLYYFDQGDLEKILKLVFGLLQDSQPEVRQLASVTLSSIIRCSSDSLVESIKDHCQKLFQSSSKPKSTEFTKIASRHSAILGLCALILAHPYDLPDWLVPIIVQLAQCLHEPRIISESVSHTFREFKRTHQDNWMNEREKFTEDELYIISDLLHSPGYYA